MNMVTYNCTSKLQYVLPNRTQVPVAGSTQSSLQNTSASGREYPALPAEHKCRWQGVPSPPCRTQVPVAGSTQFSVHGYTCALAVEHVGKYKHTLTCKNTLHIPPIHALYTCTCTYLPLPLCILVSNDILMY